MLDPLWRLFGPTLSIRLPRSRWLAEVDLAVLTWLHDAGCSYQTPLGAGKLAYPCPRPSACLMNLVDQDDGLVAVCPSGQCDDEVITAADAYEVRVERSAIIQMLRDSLGLDHGVVDDPDLIRLGSRVFGGRSVSFLLAPRRSRRAQERVESLHRASSDESLVVLVTLARHLPAGPGEPGVRWLAISDARPAADKLLFNLAPVWRAFAPGVDPGDDLWPWFLFVVDPKRYKVRFAGKVLDLAQHPQQFLLLMLLLYRAGQVLGTGDLLAGVFPGELLTEGTARHRGRLRSLSDQRSLLGTALRGLSDPPDVDPIETLRTVGLRINVGSEQIWWLSEPPRHLANLG